MPTIPTNTTLLTRPLLQLHLANETDLQNWVFGIAGMLLAAATLIIAYFQFQHQRTKTNDVVALST